MRPRAWAAIAAVALVCVVVGAGWVLWAAWRADLPPLPPPGRADEVAVNVLSQPATATEVPSTDLAFPQWRMELRRHFARRGQHVRTWLVAAQLTGVLPGMSATGPPATATVWLIGVEGYCREISGPSAGPGQPPPIPPDALCWEDRVYRGDTGRPWFSVSTGFALR